MPPHLTLNWYRHLRPQGLLPILIKIKINQFLINFIFRDGDDDGDSVPLKAPNPIAAAGAVKDALATGGVDKVTA